MGQSMQAKLREPIKIGKNGVFGSQSERICQIGVNPNKGASEPGPGEHQNIEKRGDLAGRLKGESNSFKSGQSRLPRNPMEDKSPKPCPGSYEAFDKVNYRSPFRQPKNNHLSFGSSAGRWNPNETFSGQKYMDFPGQGAHDPQLAVGNIRGGAHQTSIRRRGGEASGSGSWR